MKTNLHLQTRREFLRRSITLASVAWTIPSFLHRTVLALDHPQGESMIISPRDHPILVVIQLSGGNDGLNTLVPITDDIYYKSRPKLAIAPGQTLKVNDTVGFHPDLAKLKALYDSGKMAVIQGVGYPNPNRSHFRSMEIWHTAADSNKVEKHGWIGRYFDSACKGCDSTVAVNIGKLAPQAFYAKGPMGVSIEDPEMYRWLNKGSAAMESAESFFKNVNKKASGATPSMEEANASVMDGSLDYLQRTAMNAQLSSDKIREVIKQYHTTVTYPETEIAYGLKLVSQMIAGGLPTRIYYVSQSGYDTHSNQLTDQNRLLSELAEGVSAFYSDLEQQGNAKRVLSFSFSEFGRRVAENASGGTDHGCAGPMFVFGGSVKPGFYGKPPSLTDLDRGDLKYNVDFRSVYTTVLENWMKTDPKVVLGRPFPKLEFI